MTISTVETEWTKKCGLRVGPLTHLAPFYGRGKQIQGNIKTDIRNFTFYFVLWLGIKIIRCRTNFLVWTNSGISTDNVFLSIALVYITLNIGIKMIRRQNMRLDEE